MKSRIYPLLTLLCIFSFIILYDKIKKDEVVKVETVFPVKVEKEINEMDDMDKAMEFEIRKTKDHSIDRVPIERLLVADNIRKQRLERNSRLNSPVPGISWTERGPNNVGGRTRGLIYDLNDAVNGYKKVWAGGVSGGLWFCNDITAGTPAWIKIDDLMANLAVNCIAQDPSNPQIIYAGTGEGWFNSDAVQGLGIWKTTNGGTTWTQLASTNNSTFFFVQKIVVTSTGIVLAATYSGVQRSIDNGTSWNKVLGAGISGATIDRAADLEIGANGNIYASLGIFNVGGIWRSTDNGATYANIYVSASDEHRIELGTAPSNMDYIYALVQDRNGPDNNIGTIADNNVIKKIMLTTNATAATPTWGNVANPPWCDQGQASTDFTRTQSWYDLIATVNPTDHLSVIIGGVDLHRTTNSGTSWTQISQWRAGCPGLPFVHADQHAIVYKPGSSTELLAGNDGGVFRSTDNGATYTQRNDSYNVTQYYAGAIHSTSTNYFLAGAQDNGTHQFNAAGINSTPTVTGGDGGFSHIDQDNSNIQITAFTFNNYGVSTNGGASFTTYSFANGDFINPTDYDDVGNYLYGAYTNGTYFRWKDPATNGEAAAVSIPAFGPSLVSHVSVSPVTPNRVYFGLHNGSVVRVDNANTLAATGTAIKSPTGTQTVSCVAVDPSNEDHVLITYSNYGFLTILESTNALSGSPTWTNVFGNLPDMPLRWAIFDPRNSDWVLLATELGVWSTDNLNGALTDWQPTNTGFANVRVDMLQYRKSDRTIAAFSHGRGMWTAVVPPGTTPAISFEAGLNMQTEQTAATIDCRPYRDYTVNMNIENAPTGDANVTLALDVSGTATNGIDFAFTTNGNFAAPSNVLTFTNGATTPKTINIRIFNDAEIENEEFFKFNYAISGTTNAIRGTGPQTYAFSIRSDDITPIGGSGSYAIGALNSNLGVSSPFRSNKPRHRMQSLFTAAELNAAGFTSSKNITGLTLSINTKNSTQPYTGFTISMANTSLTSLSGGFVVAGMTQVYSNNYTSVLGNNNFTFSSPFLWDGTSNIAVQFCFQNAAADALNDQTDGTSGPLGGNVVATVYADYLSGGTPGCSLPAVFGSAFRFIATFITDGTSIATGLNTSRSEYLGPNADVYFYSTSGELLAKVKNNSSHDYGCTQVVIDRAGTGSSQFWNNNPANYLMNKTLRILPTNNNPSGNYDVTFYYTQGEVNGWQAATGQAFSSIQLVKVQSQISDVTPGNPNGGGTVQLVTPTNTSFGLNSSLTHTFNNGFSGFGAGIAGTALPVELLDFTGRLRNNSVELNWKTSFELNSKGFDIERSYDGQIFEKIGYVSAAGNSSLILNYQFTDKSISQESNYYRLKQIDLDEKFEYSRVVLIKNPLVDKNPFKVMKNPFNSTIDIQFAKVPDGNVQIRLFDGAGKSIINWNYKNVSFNRVRLDVGGRHLSAGVYVLKVNTLNKEYVERILKE